MKSGLSVRGPFYRVAYGPMTDLHLSLKESWQFYVAYN